jgi:hypothetical protein
MLGKPSSTQLLSGYRGLRATPDLLAQPALLDLPDLLVLLDRPPMYFLLRVHRVVQT